MNRAIWRWLEASRKAEAKRAASRMVYQTREVADMLGVQPASVRLWIKQGRLRGALKYRGGDKSDPRSWRWWVTWVDLRAFLEQDLFPGPTRMLRLSPMRPRGPSGRFLPEATGDLAGDYRRC